MNWLGLVIVFVVWTGIVWMLCRMLGVNRLNDDDPFERDQAPDYQPTTHEGPHD